jgi:hypothetical protein
MKILAIILLALLMSPLQALAYQTPASEKCFQTDSYEKLENRRESACFTGRDFEHIKITLISHGESRLSSDSIYIKFQVCINWECDVVILIGSEKMYIAEVRVPEFEDIYSMGDMYISKHNNKLKFNID